MHTVADVYCVGCNERLGWYYVKASDASQKYKEGMPHSTVTQFNCSHYAQPIRQVSPRTPEDGQGQCVDPRRLSTSRLNPPPCVEVHLYITTPMYNMQCIIANPFSLWCHHYLRNGSRSNAHKFTRPSDHQQANCNVR